MNLQNILNEIEKVDGEVYDRLEHVSRRHMFSMFTKKAAKAAAVGAPMAFAAALNKAYAQNDVVTEVLNFALTLEYLEAEFYNVGMDTPGLITNLNRNVFGQLQLHENAHVRLLQSALGGNAVSKPRFDFTARGAYPDVFRNFQTFTLLSQAFEDTGVRAYKGQAPRLIVNDAVLQTALQIHSVEARHAARVRELRGEKGWITGNQGQPPQVYGGEEAVTHLEISSLIPGVPYSASTEAWDEPLSREDVLNIVAPFLVTNP